MVSELKFWMIFVRESIGSYFDHKENESIEQSRYDKKGWKHPNCNQIPDWVLFIAMESMAEEEEPCKQ